MMRLFTVCTLLALWAFPAHATITVYHDFASYNAAVGGNHQLFVDFETDAGGNPVVPSENANGDDFFDIEGTTFSSFVTYESPDQPSSRVNIADIDEGIDNEIGPYAAWTGALRWTYAGTYVATGFTGIEVEPSTTIELYRNGVLVDATTVGGNYDRFQFFGFASTLPFDRVDISGNFYAIDAHYSTIEAPISVETASWTGIKSMYR